MEATLSLGAASHARDSFTNTGKPPGGKLAPMDVAHATRVEGPDEDADGRPLPLA